MKIRSDFVSNSSSSSFILGNDEVFEYFNVTKQDIVDILTEMLGTDYIKKYHRDYARQMKKHPEWYKDESKYSCHGPFYVYDMAIEADRKEAIERWGDMLDGWNATNCELNLDGSLRYAEKSVYYTEMCEALSKLYDIDYFYDYKPRENMTMTEWTKNGRVKKNVPSFIIKFLENAYKKSGIMTNRQVLEHECSRFFIHFDDNQMWTDETTIPGEADDDEETWDENDIELAKRLGKPHDGYTAKLNLTDDEIIARGVKDIKEHNEFASKQNRLKAESGYESEHYSKDRVFEVIFKNLVKAGKIDPNDEKFLSDNFPANDWEKKNGSKCHTANGQNYSWRDFANLCLTFNGHEG